MNALSNSAQRVTQVTKIASRMRKQQLVTMQIERVFPWRERALVLRLLCFLHGDDVHHLTQTHRCCLHAILPILQQYKRRTGRLALAIWCLHNIQIEFQSYYQVLDTQRIPRSRSHDPRVPPRVVSFWSERGKVEGGTVTLTPSSLPLVHSDGVTAYFNVEAYEKPMLTSVVQTQRRIYTMVSVKLRRSREDDATVTTLREYSYIKEFGEWVAPSPAEKRLYDQRGGAPYRFDLLTQDGSMALELDVPSGADSLADYYLVKRAVVSIHMNELLQHYFQSLRPPRVFPEATPGSAQSVVTECVILLHFRTLSGERQGRYSVPGQLSIERQQQTEVSASSGSNPPSATAIEHFDIVTCKALLPGSTAAEEGEKNSYKVELPQDPGYLWLRIRDSASKQIYYHAVLLHRGASTSLGVATVQTRWLPGLLEFFPTLDSRQRRCLKGQLTVSSSTENGELKELTIVAQHIGASRLERYAATVQSYTRIEV